MSVAAQTCRCMSADAKYDQFRTWRDLEPDMTDGRYADVEIRQCVICERLWLLYAVEYEAFSKSGRWARGEIEADRAATINPGEATDYLAALPTYLYGGSYFDGQSGARCGSMRWDP